MEKTISTRPIYFKIIGLLLTIIIDAFVIFMIMFFYSEIITITFAIIIFIVLGSLSLLIPNTKSVSLGENNIIISNNFKKEIINASIIREFRKTIFIPLNGYKAYFYKIKFYKNTKFGKEIWFLSKPIGIFKDDNELKTTLLTFIKNNNK